MTDQANLLALKAVSLNLIHALASRNTLYTVDRPIPVCFAISVAPTPWLKEVRSRLNKPLVALRDRNGFCPAPQDISPPDQNAQNENSAPLASNQNNPEAVSNDNGLPAGYTRVKPGACRTSYGDVVHC